MGLGLVKMCKEEGTFLAFSSVNKIWKNLPIYNLYLFGINLYFK